MILERLMNESWFGRGELEITPHYVSEIIRFVTSIIVNWKDIKENSIKYDSSEYDPFDDLIVKTLKFIQTSERYLILQLKFRNEEKVEE